MQFVLLVIGICLMKGVSNFWTVCLNGNTELSVAMSIMNALLSSGMLKFISIAIVIIYIQRYITIWNQFIYLGIIPLYLLTLGETKFSKTTLAVPYTRIGIFISYTIFPLLIGILIKSCLYCICHSNPKKFFVTILRFLSLLYIVSITGYAIASVLDLLAPSAFVVTWKVYMLSLIIFRSYKCFSSSNFSSIWPVFFFRLVDLSLHHWPHLCAGENREIVLQLQPKQ